MRRALLIGVIGGLVAWWCSPAVAQLDPSVFGRWSSAPSLPWFPTAAHMLPTGKVLMYAGDVSGSPPGLPADTQLLWDPSPRTFTTRPGIGYDLFCSGHSFLADGRLLITGGHTEYGVGLSYASAYNPFANTWARVPDMNAGRWYPTTTTLANGDALVVSGSIDNSVGVNRLPQVFQASSNTWRDLTGAVLSLYLYPEMHLAPNGKVFSAAPSEITRYLDTAGTGAWSLVATRSSGFRDYGSSVLYDDGQVLHLGGGDPPTNAAEVIDLNAPLPTWRAVAPMATARRQANATVLPDGTVLVTGGTSGPGFNNLTTPVFEAERWDPTTEAWTTLAAAQVPRLYHSVALLLPDGRVFSAGGNGYTQVELYEPPYLFKGARPTITAAPASVSHGQTFFVETPQAATIADVTWIRLGSVTHSFNQNQRINRLGFSPTTGGLNVTAPQSPNVVPPGHYMLFILNSTGVPSIAKIVRVDLGNTTPFLSSLAPASMPAGGAGFTLTVHGGNFVGTSQVRWNGAARTTTFVNAGQVTAAIPASDIGSPGSAQVTVVNPAPGGGTSNAVSFTISAPAPVLTSLAPPSTPAGGAAFTLTVNGSNFVGTSQVRWNGTGRTTTFVNAGRVTAAIPASDISTPGSVPVTVVNPTSGWAFCAGEGGVCTFTGTEEVRYGANGAYFYRSLTNGTACTNSVFGDPIPGTAKQCALRVTVASNVVAFTISGSNPVPALTSLAPSSTPAGGAAFTLTVNGSNFVGNSQVRWNGTARTTTFVNAGRVTAAIAAGDIGTQGSAQVTVVNPAPGGGTSNSLAFTISAAANPVPALTSLAPSSTPAGGAAFTLTVNGSNFVGTSQVRWNGTGRTTTFVNAGRVTAAIAAGDIGTQGSAQVTVVNPAPGGGTSNILAFTISAAANPVPALTSLAPSSTPAGGAAFTLTVNGSNFVGTSQVRWNGAARTTTFVNAGRVTAAIAASDIGTAGSAQVTVVNPAPGGGTSNALTFTTTAGGSPTLTPSVSGMAVTVAVSGITGCAVQDWLDYRLASGGSAIAWKYLNNQQSLPPSCNGTGSATFTVAAAGNYVFTLHTGSGTYNSASVTVSGSGPPPPTLTSSVSGISVTVAVSGITGCAVQDWLDYRLASGGSVISWKYLNNQQSPPASCNGTGSATFSVPAAGNYVFTLHTGSGTYNSAIVTVSGSAPPPPTLTPSVSGRSVTVAVSGITGCAVQDWLDYRLASGGNVITWKYLNNQQSPPPSCNGTGSATFTIAAAGNYVFILHTGSGTYNSAIVTVP